MTTPLRIGIVGMGGFAGWHHQAVARLEERGEARLICTCDPQATAFAVQQQTWQLAQRGVRVFADYRAMLDACHRELDLVVVPTPIQLHAEMHAAVTALGLPVYLEKPPTLDYAELEQMIANDARSPKASLVGFNFIIEPQRRALKARLLAGEFGALRAATLSAFWPRPAEYFKRNDWAGRLVLNEHVVLDSCFGNALAHFVHNILFWTGAPDLASWGQIAAVRAELYRAHVIEGADTFFTEADTTSGVTMRFALSHACSGPSTHVETVLCDHATIRYVVGGTIEIRWNDGRGDTMPFENFDGLVENHRDYYRYLRGESPRPATTLVDCRPFVTLNDLAHISAGRIATLGAGRVTAIRDEKEQKEYLAIAGLASAMERFIARGEWPSASGWPHPPGDVVTPADLPRLYETVRAMAAAQPKTP